MYFEQTKLLYTPYIAGENHCVLEANLTLNPYWILLFGNVLCTALSFLAREIC